MWVHWLENPITFSYTLFSLTSLQQETLWSHFVSWSFIPWLLDSTTLGLLTIQLNILVGFLPIFYLSPPVDQILTPFSSGLYLFCLSRTHALPVWSVFPPRHSASLELHRAVRFFGESILYSCCLGCMSASSLGRSPLPETGGQLLRGETLGLSPQTSLLLEYITVLYDFCSDDSQTHFSDFNLTLRHQSTFPMAS